MKVNPSILTKHFFNLIKTWTLFFAIIFSAFLACKKPEPPQNPQGAAGLELIAEGLVSPLSVTEAPDGTKRLFIVDQVGKIWIVNNDKTKFIEPFLDLTGKMVNLSSGYDERGLLGFAFHPNYKNNGRFFVYYSAPAHPGGPRAGANWNNTSRLAEFQVMASNPNKANLSSERIILEEDHPQSNHNGGGLAFGPDGYLYLSIGDGGSGGDTAAGHVANDWYTVNAGGNGQDVYANLLGNVLRLDINGAQPYAIPADNPFVNKPGRDEIYAYGFRNPYRFSFDMGGSHQLFLGDAGQVLYEEVDIVTKGGNYGWNVKEGTHCFNTSNFLMSRPSCPMTDTAGNLLIDPIIELPNVNNPAGGIASTVIGGNVYRGKALPDLKGKYLFGVFSTTTAPNAKVFIGTPSSSGGLWSYTQLNLINYPDNLGMYLKGFGQDESGEIYLTTTMVQGPSGTGGKVFKIINTGIL